MLNLKRGDTAVGLSFNIMSKSYKTINLTNAVVKFNLINEDNETIVSRDAQVVDSLNGKVSFFFTSNEINITGTMKGELEVTYFDGSVETFPNGGYIPITVNDKLIPFTPPKDNTPPVITVTPGGIFDSFVSIILSSDEIDTIYYTLDGTNPNDKSPIYSSPINIFNNTVFKYYGVDKYGNKTNIKTTVYTISSFILYGGLFTDTSFNNTISGGTFKDNPTNTISGGTF